MRRMLLLLIACTATTALHATVLVPAEFREVVNGSAIIAYGRVASTETEWSDDRKRIDTIVTFQVGTYLKGGPGETITFRVPGGVVGRYRSITVGAPVFTVGDEAVLFFTEREGARYVFGLNQGVFRVRRDGSTERRIVVSPPLLARSVDGERVVRGSAERRALPLETFGAQVLTVIAEAGAK